MFGIRVYANIKKNNGTEEMLSRLIPTASSEYALEKAGNYFKGLVDFNKNYQSFSLVFYKRVNSPITYVDRT